MGEYSLSPWKGKRINLKLIPFYALSALSVFFLSYLNQYIFFEAEVDEYIFFFVLPFLVEYSLVWGFWGLASSYLALLISLVYISQLPIAQASVLSLIYLITPIVSLLFYRSLSKKLNVDPLLRDLVSSEAEGVKKSRFRAWVIFVILVALALNALQSYLGSIYLVSLDIINYRDGVFWFNVWTFTNFISLIVIMPILVKGLSEVLDEFKLVNYGLFS